MAMNEILSAGDATPVTGGISTPEHLLATIEPVGNPPDDDLGRQVSWLLSLHQKKLPVEFRQLDVAGMDDVAKRSLIADIQRELGFRPLRGEET
jgi:hypothetical protein